MRNNRSNCLKIVPLVTVHEINSQKKIEFGRVSNKEISSIKTGYGKTPAKKIAPKSAPKCMKFSPDVG